MLSIKKGAGTVRSRAYPEMREGVGMDLSLRMEPLGGLTFEKEIWLKGLLTESGYELRLVGGIATGALVKGMNIVPFDETEVLFIGEKILGFPNLSPASLMARVGPLSVGPRPNYEGTAQAQKPDFVVSLDFASATGDFSVTLLINQATRLGFFLLYFTISTIRDIKSKLNQKALHALCTKYHIPASVHPSLPGSDKSILQSPDGKIDIYSRFFDFANYRLPLSQFLVDVLGHFRIHLLQLSVFGAAKVSHFEILCRVHSRYYTLDENSYPTFWDGDEGGYILSLRLRFCFIVIISNTFVVILAKMDLFAFIRHSDPTKVRVGERNLVDRELKLLKITEGRTVTLDPPATTVSRGSSDSIYRLFDERDNARQEHSAERDDVQEEV
ncbi:hypothetical protein Tco_1375310, partial [Tanacetum coccineum]